MGLLDALGLDLEGILGDLFPEDDSTDDPATEESSTEA